MNSINMYSDMPTNRDSVRNAGDNYCKCCWRRIKDQTPCCVLCVAEVIAQRSGCAGRSAVIKVRGESAFGRNIRGAY